MRYGRTKSNKKTLNFFNITGYIKPPYKILLDGSFLAMACRQKVPIYERFKKLLQERDFSLHICRSTLDELLGFSGEYFQQARQFGLDECEIIESLLTLKGRKNSSLNEVGDCCENEKLQDELPKKICFKMCKSAQDIRSLVIGGNSSGYFVASSDINLSHELRRLSNIPLFHLSHKMIILESPSLASRKQSLKIENIKQITAGWKVTSQEQEMILDSIKRCREQKVNEPTYQMNLKQRLRCRKAKGPNPLSCKKKKSVERNSKNLIVSKKIRRKRKRKTGDLPKSDTVFERL